MFKNHKLQFCYYSVFFFVFVEYLQVSEKNQLRLVKSVRLDFLLLKKNLPRVFDKCL